MAIDGGSVEIRFEGDITPLRRSVEEAVDSIKQVKSASDDLDKNLSGFGNSAKKEFETFADSAQDAFVRAIDSSDTFVANLSQIGSALKTIGFGILTAGATAATKSLVKMAKGAITDTSALENVQIQMIGLTDSVEKGNRAMAMAVQYFKNNPFNRFDVTSATKNLLQFGASLNDIPNLLDKLGKVSLSTGASIATLAYYYQRTIADGRIATRDLLQMQNQGVPIFGALAKQLGVSTGAVREFAAKGKIALEDFQAAFDNLVSDEAMERFNETLSRQLDRFKGRMSNMRASLAGYSTTIEEGLVINEQGLYRSWTRLIRTFADIMDSETGQNLYKGFEKLGTAISKIIDGFTKLIEPALKLAGQFLNFIGDNSELLIPMLGGLAVALGKLGSNIPVVGDLIRGITSNFSKLKSGILGLVSTYPVLSAFLAIFTVGFMDAYKNDEKFRQTIIDLGTALKDIVLTLMQAGRGVFTAFVDVIKELASQGIITGILQGVASALKVIAQAIASIPPETLASLISFFLSLKLIKTSPLAYAIALIGMFATYVEQMGGLPKALETIGHNMMTGLVNGLREGATKVFNFVKNVAQTVIDTFKNMWGIHSPSTVGYDLGKNWVLGIANGVTDTSDVMQVAMNNLAEDVLKASERVLSNKVSFGVLDYKGEYREWKKISKLFAEGSEQYAYAIDKMEEARKNANLKILDLQKNYNDELDSTINKISSMYGLFSEVDLSGGKNSTEILHNLDEQVARMNEWATAQEKIASLGLEKGLVEELQAMGVENTVELSAIANMTSSELATLNDFWLKKQEIANKAGVAQMKDLKDDTLEQINQLKSGIDGTTIDIADVGGRLVESISEGVYGAMPTLESAMAQLGNYIEKARKALGQDTTPYSENEDEDDLIGGVKQEITASMEKLKNMLPNLMLGAIGAWGVLKFGPKVLKALFNKIGQGLLGGGTVSQGIAGSLFKSADLGLGLKAGLLEVIDKIPREEHTVGGKVLDKIQDWLTPKSDEVVEAAKNTTKTSQSVQTIAQNTTQISQSVQTTGQGMSKASGWMSSIKQGAQTIIWVAGAIAAVAVACKIAYDSLKDVEWKKFNMAVIDMAEAVLAFSGLGKVISRLKIKTTDLLKIVGIAADIALVALACRAAYELMKDIDFLQFQVVILEMAEALIVMGGIAIAVGAITTAMAGVPALGMAMVIGLAGDIVLVALACKTAYDTMKDMDWPTWGNMLGAMINALAIFGGFSTIIGIFTGLVALGWASVLMVCDELVKTSEALLVVYHKVPDDFDNVNAKIDLIKKVLNKVIDTDLGSLIGAIVTSWTAGPLERTMEMYGKVAEELAVLSQIDINEDKVTENLDHVKASLEKVRSETGVISGWLRAWSEEANADSVESAARVVVVYGEVADTLSKLGNVKIPENVNEGVTKITQFLGTVLETLKTNINLVNKKVKYDEIEKAVGNAQSIINKFTEIIPTVAEGLLGENVPTVSVEDAEKVIENTGKIITAITDFMEDPKLQEVTKIGYKEQIVDKTQSILNKFTGILPTVKQLTDNGISDEAKKSAVETIHTVQDIVYELGKINETRSIENKEKIVGYSQSILNKFTGLAPTLDQLTKQGFDTDKAIGQIQNLRHIVWEIGQINQEEANSLDFKAEIVDKSKTILAKLIEFSDLMTNLKSSDKGSMIESLTESLRQLLSGVEDTLLNQTTGFETVGNQLGQALSGGIQAIDFSNTGNEVQSKIWQAINSRMNDEYYQGRSLGETLRQGFYDIDYGNAGWWAVQGFIDGANNRAYGNGGVYHTGWWIADTFLRGLEDRGEQGSPWRTTLESGAWAIKGLIEGIRSQESVAVGEATSLADQIVDALTIDDASISPSLTMPASLAPNMVYGSYDIVEGTGRGVQITQNITAYTPYDIEQTSRDLAWELSKV